MGQLQLSQGQGILELAIIAAGARSDLRTISPARARAQSSEYSGLKFGICARDHMNFRFPVQARVTIRVCCRTQCPCESTVVRPHYHLHTGGNGPGNFHASSYRVATVLMKYIYSDGPSIILISIQKLENTTV